MRQLVSVEFTRQQLEALHDLLNAVLPSLEASGVKTIDEKTIYANLVIANFRICKSLKEHPDDN